MMQRLTVDLGPDQAEAVDAIARELSVTKTFLLREGLRLIRMAVREARHGNSIGIIVEGKTAVVLGGIWDDVKKETASSAGAAA